MSSNLKYIIVKKRTSIPCFFLLCVRYVEFGMHVNRFR